MMRSILGYAGLINKVLKIIEEGNYDDIKYQIQDLFKFKSLYQDYVMIIPSRDEQRKANNKLKRIEKNCLRSLLKNLTPKKKKTG